MSSPVRLLPYVALAVVWVVWGSTFLAMRIVVQEAPFDLAAEVSEVAGRETDMGAVVTCTGVVRDNDAIVARGEP